MRRAFRFAVKARGMSLVEVMIAMVILLFVALALMQTVTVAIDANMKNALMDEGVKVAGENMSRMRNIAVANLPSGTTPTTDTRTVRNLSLVYSISTFVNTSGNLTIINTTVSWPWKGQTYTQTMSTVRRE